MSSKKKRLLLVDAHALIHRAFHALPPLTTKKGEQINALYGFLLILVKAIKELKPTHIVVAFDSKGKTFRHKKYKEYKANRPPAAEELVSQFPLVHEAIDAFGLTSYAVPSYEADDLIGTVCHQLEGDATTETIILSGDLDLLQLVDDNTKMMKLHKGVKDTVLYDPKMVEEKHGYRTDQVIEYKGLRGDTSDNIPGVKGIGEKGATNLLQEYDTIEEIYDNLEKLTGRVQKALTGSKEDALMSRDLATIATDAPIDFELESTRVESFDTTQIGGFLRKYEFTSMLQQINTLPGAEIKEGLFADKEEEGPKRQDDKRFTYILVDDAKKLQHLTTELKKQPIFAFDTETTSLDPHSAQLVGISISWKAGEGYYVPTPGGTVPPELVAVLENEKIKKTGHNIKFDMEALHPHGVEVRGVAFDSMVASFILNASSRGHGLDNLVFVEFGHEMQPITELIGKGKNQITMADVPVEDASWYACEDADFTWRLYTTFKGRIEKSPMKDLFYKMEIPTLTTLATMEQEGIRVDVEFLNTMSKELHKQIRALEKKIYKTAGVEFNIASPAQLKEVLFDTLQLPTDGIKKTKTGHSTAASELDKLRDSHPIINMITEYRELAKLTSTYIDTLPKLVNPRTGRIHTNYSQIIAATGRLSSTHPNLQNIPIRTELGREIRKAFVADRGNRLLALDYSQIELRVVAHLADDPVMKESFQKGEDIHSRTAAELNDVALEKVTKDMRRQAKAINFGILYGMGVQGIQRDSGASREEAQMFLDRYFTVHTGIAAYVEKIKEFAHEHQYAETLFGRRRPLPEIRSSNRMIAAGAERAAVNMPVQGTAADLMKLAMIEVQQKIDDDTIDARMLLQVHDELVFEVHKDNVETVAGQVKEIMETIHELEVPLVAEIEYGTSWGSLQSL